MNLEGSGSRWPPAISTKKGLAGQWPASGKETRAPGNDMVSMTYGPPHQEPGRYPGILPPVAPVNSDTDCWALAHIQFNRSVRQ